MTIDHAVKCKICGQPGIAKVDSSYSGDPMKLLPMFTCNRCYDLRDQRIKIETLFKRLCHQLAVEKPNAQKRDQIHELLQGNCGKFSRWCSELLRRQHPVPSSRLYKAILDDPEQWYRSCRDFEEAANNSGTIA